MARVLYENLKHQGITDEAVSRGLHAAARRLRDEWSRKFTNGGSRGGVARGKKQRSPEIRRNGRRDIIACDDDDDDDGTEPLYWIPFVHFGV
ncbi:unnamed protein product [Fusarium graminearum]|nr:unnamed protein product [Fusarium graminearum]CAG2005069.1 unnamed protein product [Fusarium graminearum]